MKTKIFTFVIASALVLSLTGCQYNTDKDPDGAVTDNTSSSDGLEPIGDVTAADGVEKTPETVQKTAYELVEDIMTANALKYEGGEVTHADKKYGSVDKAYYELEDGGIINVTSYKSIDDAKAFAGYYGEDGSHFTSDDETMIIDYIYPIHLWRYDNYIISYASPTAEELQDLNIAFGVEFAGAGSRYYSPEFVSDIEDALAAAGYDYESEWCDELQQLYMYSPERMCRISVSNGDQLFVSRYKDEATAMDHAARFSPDGKAYTGLGGHGATTIQFGRAFPPHFFRKGSVVVEYISENCELMGVLESVYGKQFAGDKSNTPASRTELSFSAEYIRTDCFDFDVELPQYAIIRSVDDLNRFYTDYNGVLDLESRETVYADSTIGWLDRSEKYDDEWFKENDLLLVVLSEGSGSNRHEVTSVTRDSISGTKVSIKRIVPESGTCDMAEWTIFIEINSKVINPLETVDIEIAE